MANHTVLNKLLIGLLIVLSICIMISWKVLFKGYFRYVCNSIIYNRRLVRMIDNSLPVIKKRNVVFLYSHDYHEIPEYFIYSKKLLDEYCELHGYTIIVRNYKNENKVSPYWLRVKDLVDMSTQYDDNTVFIYMDLDTCINPKFMHVSVDTILHTLDNYNEWNMYIGKDPNLSLYINSGVMIIKNTQWSKNMLNLWWSKYNAANWKIENNKWICMIRSGSKCSWAGDNYEQGELETLYINNAMNARSNIAILHMNIISNHFRKCNKSFIYHLMGSNDKDRLSFFKELTQDYEKTTKEDTVQNI